MFASMFKSLFIKSGKKTKKESITVDSEFYEITQKNVEDMLIKLKEIDVKETLDNSISCSVSLDNIIDGIEAMPIDDTDSDLEYVNDCTEHIDDTKSEVSSIGENQLVSDTVDEVKNSTIKQINSLQCLFTWNIKPNNKKNIIASIQNKYGEYNLNITSTEFTFERYVGNLIIGYELFHKGESELGQMKVLEIGQWLEELDNGSDEFYLSINTGLQHVMKATFIHMLFATNLTGECKWLLDDIVSLAKMDSKSKATINAVHAAVLTEYGGNSQILKKACTNARKACELDPNTSHWFYIHSLALTTQRQFLQSHKSNPSENEINAIQQAIMLSDGKNTLFNYHRMILDRDTAIRYYHDNKNKHDNSWFEKNRQANKTIVQMVKTIISMDPKDPHLIIKCARILMTLPVMVRDFDLGKQYLTKAFEMAPNDVTVLKAIEKTIEVYKDISKKQRPRTFETKQNHPPLKNKTTILSSDLGLIVKKQKNGQDPVPYLTNLVSKYDGLDKSKIIAQLCSYTVLFTNNLRSGVEQFIKLIEQPGMANNYLITQHFSSFGSKKFHLAELICNEIRLATNSSSTASEDMLFYFKMLTKIMETCNLQMKDVDSSLKAKLIIDSSARSSFDNKTYQNETNSSDNESVVENTSVKHRNKSRKPKHLQGTGPKVFTKTPVSNKGPNMKNKDSYDNFNSRYRQNQSHAIDQMQFKMSKFINSSSPEVPRFSNNSNVLTTEDLRNVQTQSQVEQYTHQLYQHILTNNSYQHQRTVPDTPGAYFNSHSNHMFPNSSSTSQYYPFQNRPYQNEQPPSLLDIRPQINEQNSPRWQKPKKWTNKKK